MTLEKATYLVFPLLVHLAASRVSHAARHSEVGDLAQLVVVHQDVPGSEVPVDHLQSREWGKRLTSELSLPKNVYTHITY